mmetsp:Transcript_19181/g.72473  ORF Transcript_19181/g.72473 Transcript_19181/m.72473 type:complete len:242 (+) Transcript_19181:1139-1864(+)
MGKEEGCSVEEDLCFPGLRGRREEGPGPHGDGQLAPERRTVHAEGAVDRQHAGLPPAERHQQPAVPVTSRVEPGICRDRRRPELGAAAEHLQCWSEGRQGGEGRGGRASHPVHSRTDCRGGLPSGCDRRVRELDRVQPARVQHRLLPPGTELHARDHAGVDLRWQSRRRRPLRRYPRGAEGGSGEARRTGLRGRPEGAPLGQRSPLDDDHGTRRILGGQDRQGRRRQARGRQGGAHGRGSR